MNFHGVPVVDLRDKLPRNSTPKHGPLTHRALNIISGIAVHWDAAPRPHAYDSVARYVAEANYHINKDWGSGWRGDGLMYHFKIDNTGVIFYCRDISEMVWAVTDMNPYYISICLDGTVGQEPTREQAEGLQALLDELCFNHPEFPASQADVRGHKEVPSNATACPGSFMTLVESYRGSRNTHPERFPYDYPPQPAAPTQPVEVAPAPVAPEPTPALAPVPLEIIEPAPAPTGQVPDAVIPITVVENPPLPTGPRPEYEETFVADERHIWLKVPAAAIDMTGQYPPKGPFSTDRPIAVSGYFFDGGRQYWRGRSEGWYGISNEDVLSAAEEAPDDLEPKSSFWARFLKDPFGALVRWLTRARS